MKSSKVELPGELSPFTDNRRLEVRNEQTQNTVIISQHNVIANVKILDNFLRSGESKYQEKLGKIVKNK